MELRRELARISIVGTGYVGLCTAVGFAEKGYKVIASTNDRKKAESIGKGVPPFYEPGLQQSLSKAVKNGYLKCVLNREEAILDTDLTFIAVGTPNKADGSIDLKFIRNASSEIGEAIKKKKMYHLVVVKSTVVPGTTENVVKPTVEKHSKKQCGDDFGLCMNPEFLREGSALNDTLHPDRVIMGEFDEKSGGILENLYQGFYCDELPPIIRTNLATAELTKYVNNTFLATKISFINQIANICRRISGVDVRTVARCIGLDKRINSSFLNAGLGYGGSCLPKDVKALIAFSRKLGYDPLLLEALKGVNETQPYEAVALARNLIGDLQSKQVAVLGLAFKPNTDDMREALSTKVINQLLEEGADVTVYDPVAMGNARRIFDDRIKYVSSAIECIRGSDCCIIATEWEEFEQLKPDDFLRNMRTPAVVDGRRIYCTAEYRPKLKYAAIGLG